MELIDRLFGRSQLAEYINHRNLYILGIATVLCGLSWSNVVMSIGQFILIGNWLLELDFATKFKRLFSNKVALILLAFFFMHLLGLLWTEDLAYAWKDIRIKLPILVLTLIIASSEILNRSQIQLLLKIYIASVLFVSFVSFAKLLGWTNETIVDKRELSIRISHIRYGLMIAFASIISIYFFLTKYHYKFLFLFLSLYFFAALIAFELYTGLIIYLFIIVFALLRMLLLKRIHRIYRLASLLILIIILTIPSYLILSVYKDFNAVQQELDYDQTELPSHTLNGNVYHHYLDNPMKENGYYLWRYISYQELEKEWNERSEIAYDSSDRKGQSLSQTLMRYLSSKGLKKDSVGISQLSSIDITAIENGDANVYYTSHSKIENRIHSTFYELKNYRKYQLADGYSIAMRLEYWNLSKEIIADNLLWGVGTGDIQAAFDAKYEAGQSLITDKNYWRRSHNQYLSAWIQVGIPGLILLLLMLFYPLSLRVNRKNMLYIPFILLISFSMLTEDTLETQAGATLFSIFNALFLFNPKA